MLEFVFGTDPLADSSAQRPVQSVINVAGSDYLALTFRRRTGANGVTVVVESTSDLATGIWLADAVQFGTPTDNGDGTETVTFRDIVPLGSVLSRFLRIRATAD